MSEETVNIRIPDPLELQQYRIQVGDTVQFIEKMTGTQDDLDAFSGQLNLTVADMQSAADQIASRYAQILQTGQQVADDKLVVNQLRTETGQDRQLAEQAATTAAQQVPLAAAQADRGRDEADRAEVAAGQSQSASTSALNAVSSLSPRIGLNIGAWKIEDGELIVAHLSTATPSIADGDFILEYEAIEEFA